MDQEHTWQFPRIIQPENVADYIKKFEGYNNGDTLIFDLGDTISIHSSFIGFLIHVKHKTKKTRGKLKLIISYSVERLLIMVNIIDYFSPEIIIKADKKTA